MRPHQRDRLGHVLAGGGLVLCLRDVWVHHACRMAIRIAEIEAFLAHAVQFVLRAVVAEPVAAMVGEPQFARLGMPVETLRVAHAGGDHLHARAVRVVAADLRVLLGRLADVAGRAERHVELLVRAEGEVLPVVVLLGRQVEFGRHVDRLHVGLVLDVVEAQHLVDRHDVQRAALDRDSRGLREFVDHDAARALVAGVRHFVDSPESARAHVDLALVAASHRAAARHAGRPELNLEALGHLERVHRDLAGRGLGVLAGVRRQLRVLELVADALLPGRWWRGGGLCKCGSRKRQRACGCYGRHSCIGFHWNLPLGEDAAAGL